MWTCPRCGRNTTPYMGHQLCEQCVREIEEEKEKNLHYFALTHAGFLAASPAPTAPMGDSGTYRADSLHEALKVAEEWLKDDARSVSVVNVSEEYQAILKEE